MWQGRKAFVTGATSGIGLALAERLIRDGADVWICAPEEGAVTRTVARLREGCVRPHQIVGGTALDVSDRSAVDAARERVLLGLDGLDLLINNAGIATVGYLEDTQAEDYERMMAVNFFGTVWVTRAFLPHLMQTGGGAVCCVASTLGAMGLFGYSAYAASKFAVVGYCECLRQDLLPYRVSVHVAMPADVDTPQLRANLARKPAETAALAGAAKLATPEVVAEAILQGIEHGRFRIPVGTLNALILGAAGVAPWLVHRYIDRQLLRYWRDHPRLPGAS